MNAHLPMLAAERFDERVTFKAQGRSIEGVLTYRLSSDPEWSCVLAGPHPMLGGAMGNNVVQTLVDRVVSAGAVCMSFNYAGVGASEGGPIDWPVAMSTFWRRATIPEERQWCEDAAAALRELVRQTDGLPCAAIGYSFGCWAISRAVADHSVEALALVSPNPLRHDFSALSGVSAPLLVIHGDQEIECSTEQLQEWFDGLREPKCIRRVHAAEHFFRQREADVASYVLEYLARKNPPFTRVDEDER